MTSPGPVTDRVQVVRDGRVMLDRTVDGTTRRLVEAYLRAWATVRADLDQAATAAAREADSAGGQVGPAQLRQGRLAASLRALEEQLLGLQRHAAVTITGQLPQVLDASTATLRELGAVTGARFDLPQPGALAFLVDRSTRRISGLIDQAGQQARDSLRDNLLRGAARGESVQQVARNIVDGARDTVGVNLTRALVVARTELLDASRTHASLSYQASGQVTGQRWLATLDVRTCPSCLAMNGTILAVDDIVEDHQQGRCVGVPILADDQPGDSTVPDARAWFDSLSSDEQLQVMGPGRLEALQNGTPWEALATRRSTDGWRDSYAPTPVQDLTAVG